FFASRRRHTRLVSDWSSDVCSSDLVEQPAGPLEAVEIRIRSVYAGKKYDDLCLSDVQLYVTAKSADNPAFEKQRLEKVLSWKKRSEERRVGKEGRCRWGAAE